MMMAYAGTQNTRTKYSINLSECVLIAPVFFFFFQIATKFGYGTVLNLISLRSFPLTLL